MTRADRPNILLVVLDSLSSAACRDHLDQLPAFHRLQQESLCFSNCYCPSPASGPARASLLTGLDMAAHGVWTDGVPLPVHETTLQERCVTQGYHAWLVGRRHLSGVSNWTTEHPRAGEFHQVQWAHGPLHRSRQNAYLAWLQDTAPAAYDSIFAHQADPDSDTAPSAQHAALTALPDVLSFNHWVGAVSYTHLTLPTTSRV